MPKRKREHLEQVLKEYDIAKRQFHAVSNMKPYLDADKKRYVYRLPLDLRARVPVVTVTGQKLANPRGRRREGTEESLAAA